MNTAIMLITLLIVDEHGKQHNLEQSTQYPTQQQCEADLPEHIKTLDKLNEQAILGYSIKCE